jgi:hypothetical protein
MTADRGRVYGGRREPDRVVVRRADDFREVRRGLDPHQVDSHLQWLACQIEGLYERIDSLERQRQLLQEAMESRPPIMDAPVVRPYITHPPNSGHQWPGWPGPNLGQRFD